MQRLSRIKAVICDWDGVFNDGSKDAEGGSPFSEGAAWASTSLRFALWLRKEESSYSAIITGQNNAFAERFAQREHLHGIYAGYTHKPGSLRRFLVNMTFGRRKYSSCSTMCWIYPLRSDGYASRSATERRNSSSVPASSVVLLISKST
ncbi:MAG: hypothetical protein IPH60_08535 [Flavobacteriales bacterium]|nr:hypothetical protein [Flavobacteriales bacterium]